MWHEEKILNSYYDMIYIMKLFIHNWLRIQESRSNFSILAVAVRLKIKNWNIKTGTCTYSMSLFVNKTLFWTIELNYVEN